MAPTLLFDIAGIDLDRVLHGAEEIERVNPHRGAMRMLDAITWTSDDLLRWIGYKDVGRDEFWAPGHIPGQPIFPGVLMIEAAAQLASYRCLTAMPDYRFMGFVGVESFTFRGQVLPGDRLYLLLEQRELRPRRCVCAAQGYCNGTLVFNGAITGMPIQVKQPGDTLTK